MIDTLKNLISPREKDLNAKCRKTRQAALEACTTHYNAARDDRVTELRGRIAEAEAQHAKHVADAQRAAREAFEAARRDFVSDFYAEAGPLVAQWAEEPGRKLATAIGNTLAKFNAREELELGRRHGDGVSRAAELLGYAFADLSIVVTPAAVRAFGADGDASCSRNFWPAVATVNRALTAGVSVLHEAIAELERGVERVAASCADHPIDARMVERYALVRRLEPEAVEAFDRECEQQRRHELSQRKLPVHVAYSPDKTVLTYGDGTTEERASA